MKFDSYHNLFFFLQITESAYVKRFVETLKKDHRFLTCNITSDCLEFVKRGNAVYSAVKATKSIIRKLLNVLF